MGSERRDGLRIQFNSIQFSSVQIQDSLSRSSRLSSRDSMKSKHSLPLTGSLAQQCSSPVAFDNQRHPAPNNTQHPALLTSIRNLSSFEELFIRCPFKLKAIIAALRRPRPHKLARQSNTRQAAHRSLTFHRHGNCRVPSIRVPFFCWLPQLAIAPNSSHQELINYSAHFQFCSSAGRKINDHQQPEFFGAVGMKPISYLNPQIKIKHQSSFGTPHCLAQLLILINSGIYPY